MSALGDVLGRTRRVFAPVWLSLMAASPPCEPDWVQNLVKTSESLDVPIDISSQPALWGGAMRATEATLVSIVGTTVERATDTKHASDLAQAELLQLLSAIGRDYIDVLFLRYRRALEEFQIEGALESLEMARQEGHIRHTGLMCDESALATLGMWQFHDAFELLLIPWSPTTVEPYEMLAPLAKERNVGVVLCRPRGYVESEELRRPSGTRFPRMIGVRSADEALAAVGQA